jgi:hypothetical protein
LSVAIWTRTKADLSKDPRRQLRKFPTSRYFFPKVAKLSESESPPQRSSSSSIAAWPTECQTGAAFLPSSRGERSDFAFDSDTVLIGQPRIGCFFVRVRDEQVYLAFRTLLNISGSAKSLFGLGFQLVSIRHVVSISQF